MYSNWRLIRQLHQCIIVCPDGRVGRCNLTHMSLKQTHKSMIDYQLCELCPIFIFGFPVAFNSHHLYNDRLGER